MGRATMLYIPAQNCVAYVSFDVERDVEHTHEIELDAGEDFMGELAQDKDALQIGGDEDEGRA